METRQKLEVNRGTLWRQCNPELAKTNRIQYYKNNQKKIIKRNADWLKDNPDYALWHRAKQRAKRNGLDFNIEQTDVIIPPTCPLLEFPIIWGNGEQSPALDRIDNTKGYIKGNVWVISHLANRMKNNGTIMQLDTFCKNWMMAHRPDMDDRWVDKYQKENDALY